MDILLIAGLWLDGSVWDNVAVQLEARGHRAVPITLPGQGDGNASATLADQVVAVVAAVDAAAGRPMVVGHSAACSLAWLAADTRPGKISKVAFIGGSPPRTAGQTSTPPRKGRCPSRAGRSSKGRIPLTWTTPPSRPSRRLRPRSRKGSFAG